MVLDRERRIFVQLGYTDMRKQINGLAATVQAQRPDGPLDGSYFIFCGKTRRLLKVLYWDRTGFCLWQKRLEEAKFPWPKEGSELDEVTRHHIRLVLKGIDAWKEHRELKFKIAG